MHRFIPEQNSGYSQVSVVLACIQNMCETKIIPIVRVSAESHRQLASALRLPRLCIVSYWWMVIEVRSTVDRAVRIVYLLGSSSQTRRRFDGVRTVTLVDWVAVCVERTDLKSSTTAGDYNASTGRGRRYAGTYLRLFCADHRLITERPKRRRSADSAR